MNQRIHRLGSKVINEILGRGNTDGRGTDINVNGTEYLRSLWMVRRSSGWITYLRRVRVLSASSSANAVEMVGGDDMAEAGFLTLEEATSSTTFRIATWSESNRTTLFLILGCSDGL
jgi:hypothetical protein